MITKWMLLLIGGMSAIALGAALAESSNLQPMVVTNPTGTLHINQPLPGTCDNVDQSTPVTQGRIEITPAEGLDVPGGRFFTVSRADLSFAPFTIERHCMTQDSKREYRELGVQLDRAVSFTATASSPGVFQVTIPTNSFRIHQSAIVAVDDGAATSETGYVRPSQDVTGTIDLAQGTIQMTIVIATTMHFRWGCLFDHCLVDVTEHGTLTADLSGAIVFPDADGDGVPDRNDSCRFVPNPDQSPVATPVIAPPADLTIASCADHQIGSAEASDVCDGGPVTLTNNAPGTFALGANVVTWTGQDAKSRVGTATQTVTVVDTTPPIFTFIPPDITMNNCGPAALGVPAATDDCAGSPTFTNNAPAIFLVGTTPVTWTARDASGNTALATQMVTVHDLVPPTVACVPDGPPGGTFRVTGIDACGAPTIRLGSYVLANGEHIKINETGQAGVRLVNVIGPEQIKHFHVGEGEAVITATDGSGNVASAVCR